jgi:diketogulonate reductase-like aldo/keto reductase
VAEVAEKAGVSVAAAWYALVMEAGVVVLNGTRDAGHMREDLDVNGKVEEWRRTSKEGEEVWGRCWGRFKDMIDG